MKMRGTRFDLQKESVAKENIFIFCLQIKEMQKYLLSTKYCGASNLSCISVY